MSNMQDILDELVPETREFKLTPNVTLELEGLSFPEVKKFTRFTQSKDYGPAMEYIFETVIRKALDRKGIEYTEEQIQTLIKRVSGKKAMDMVRIVTELSGLSEDDKKKLDLASQNLNKPEHSRN